MIKTENFDTKYCNHPGCYEPVIIQITGEQNKCECENTIALCEPHFKLFAKELLPGIHLINERAKAEGRLPE